ncbi:MAG: hypothetical protein EAZ57_05685 [Cytophagales bacterium]|nr:MAG: hypothetical protein EAZ67_06590 [Cytophagales bacterium]TAF60845.1 MAG: hypothetical protein EAZ57_05685 [Cytophagales bacterium]
MLKNFFLAVLSVLMVLCFAFQTPPAKLVRTRVEAANVSMSVPKGFHLMNDDEVASKYFSTQRPTAIFTNDNGKIDLGINMTETEWRERDVAMLGKFSKSSIMNAYTKVTIIQEKEVKINGRVFYIIEFVGEIPEDTKAIIAKGKVSRYHYMQYTIANGQQYVFNFNCPSAQKAQWQIPAKNMMNSVRIGIL